MVMELIFAKLEIIVLQNLVGFKIVTFVIIRQINLN